MLLYSFIRTYGGYAPAAIGPVPRIEVLYDDHRHREAGRQAAKHPAKSHDTARGRRDCHDAV